MRKELMGADATETQVIRVEMPQSNAGIAAALRRAFQTAANDPTEHDFEALLARLN